MKGGASLLAVLFLLLGCASATTTGDDPTTGLTVSGPSESVDAFLLSAQSEPHKWSLERRWSTADGSQSVRLRWPTRPAANDVGAIVALIQMAEANGLAISDSQIVETRR
jgi:hypothetical protein